MRLPLDASPGTALPQPYVDLFRDQPTLDVELPDDTAAVAVTRHCDVRTVLSDNRFSRAQFQTRTLWASAGSSLALVTSDPPSHTARRRSIQRWFTRRSAERARPFIESVAERLVGELLAIGPPADIYAGFCHPFPNLVHMNVLGLDPADLPFLASRMTTAWSSGHYSHDEVARATLDLRGYFESQLTRSRRGGRRGGLIDALAHDDSADRLGDAEIVALSMGLLISGAETTGCLLAMGLVEILQQPALSEGLRRNPGQIPTVVEELLRWMWFGGTAGRAHVATADIELHDRLISRGKVVVPMIDMANRDVDVFPDADRFCPYRSPNPHLGFGYGPHRCVGMSYARLELEIGLRVLLSRLDRLTLVSGSELDWRADMFTRGLWRLPVTWQGGRK